MNKTEDRMTAVMQKGLTLINKGLEKHHSQYSQPELILRVGRIFPSRLFVREDDDCILDRTG